MGAGAHSQRPAGWRGLTRHTHTVQLPSDGEKTSPSARATPSCKQPANQRRVEGGAHAGAQGWGLPGLTCAAGAAAPGRGGQRVGARHGAADGLAEHSSSLWGQAQLSATASWHGEQRHGERGRLPGRHSSGTPAPSSECPAPGGPPGTSSEGLARLYRGLPPRLGTARWPGTRWWARRGEVGCPEVRQGGGKRESPWGPGGVPQGREGAGRAWGDAAGTAGWVRAPGWTWGSLEGKERASLREQARGVLLTRPGKGSLQLPSQETRSPLSRYPGRQEHR